MASSSLLRICLDCKNAELPYPPPKECPYCKGTSSYKQFKEQEKQKDRNTFWEHRSGSKPKSLSSADDIVKTEEDLRDYKRSFIYLNFGEKLAILKDAHMVLRSILLSSHSFSEMQSLTSKAESIGKLAESLGRCLSQGVLGARELEDE
jgi:hypothetical protein